MDYGISLSRLETTHVYNIIVMLSSFVFPSALQQPASQYPDVIPNVTRPDMIRVSVVHANFSSRFVLTEFNRDCSFDMHLN